jgi:SET and MYND domain-containing protein
MYIVTGFFVLTYCDLYRQAIPSSNIDNYNLVDALESRILSFTASGYRWTNIMIHECWIDFILTDISKVDENQLVLYAQMANLASLILPSLELDLKEIAHTFSKVNLHNVP